MILEKLLQRAKEIEAAITNTSNQLQTLFGHKSENQHYIQLAQTAEKVPEDAIPAVAPVESPVE